MTGPIEARAMTLNVRKRFSRFLHPVQVSLLKQTTYGAGGDLRTHRHGVKESNDGGGQTLGERSTATRLKMNELGINSHAILHVSDAKTLIRATSTEATRCSRRVRHESAR